MFDFKHATPLIRMASIATDPTQMIPVKPGQSIHLGYEPISEEDAFLIAKRKPSPFSLIGLNQQMMIRVLRENTTAERLIQLIYKFNYINHTISIVVPKEEFLNCPPQKSLFRCKIIFCNTTIHIEILATSAPNFDLDEFIIWTNRLNGSTRAHKILFENLKKYIEADGNMDPRFGYHTEVPRVKRTEPDLDSLTDDEL
jgi:hypothetical protein